MPATKLTVAGRMGLIPRITRINLIATLVAVLVGGALLVAAEFRSLQATFLGDLGVQARIVGQSSASALVFGDAAAATEVVDGLAASPAILEAEVVTRNGSVLARFARAGVRSPAAPWPEAGDSVHLQFADLVQPVDFDGQQVGSLRLRASLDGLYARLLAYAGTTLLVCLAALGLATLLIARMRRSMLAAEEKLHYLTNIDPVTQLPNRHSFQEFLAFAVSRVEHFGGDVALLMIDLDNFKLVNDGFGHQNGDALLGALARRIAGLLRAVDVICRIGGDEFAVVLENVLGRDHAIQVANKVFAALAEPFDLMGQEVFVSATIGISTFSGGARGVEDLIRDADTALHAAKRRGKNAYEVFDSTMNALSRQRLSLESRLRRAIEREELVLHYQPQFAVAGEGVQLVGCEALVRWNDGARGLVGPGEFIPLAEECGLIVPIGNWVLRRACIDARRWTDSGLPPVPVAVNLSARQLDGGSLFETVLETLVETGTKPELLELEVTESALMKNPDASARMLQRLSEAGVRVAIDDFGTGYSSMAYLKRFPIDKLKIDRSFIAEVTERRDDAAIIAAIVAMSRSLDIEVIAEGVETAAQLAKVRALGCERIQGFLLGRPMAAAEFAAFAAARGAAGSRARPAAVSCPGVPGAPASAAPS